MKLTKGIMGMLLFIILSGCIMDGGNTQNFETSYVEKINERSDMYNESCELTQHILSLAEEEPRLLDSQTWRKSVEKNITIFENLVERNEQMIKNKIVPEKYLDIHQMFSESAGFAQVSLETLLKGLEEKDEAKVASSVDIWEESNQKFTEFKESLKEITKR